MSDNLRNALVDTLNAHCGTWAAKSEDVVAVLAALAGTDATRQEFAQRIEIVIRQVEEIGVAVVTGRLVLDGMVP